MMKITLLLLTLLSEQHLSKATGWSWSPLSAADGAVPRVSGHTSATITADGTKSSASVLLFGGLTGAAGSPTTNDLWQFDCQSDKWIKLLDNNKSLSSCPRRRMYAASATLGRKFYIFGGWDPGMPGSGGEFLDDIWSFDLVSKQWSEEMAKLPFPVSRHAAVTMGNRVIIHTFRGVLIFDDKDGGTIIYEQPTAPCNNGDGASPESLSMCAMAALGDDKVVLFGGSDKKQQISSELFVLDTKDWTWTKLVCPVVDTRPTALASASMAPLSKDSCIVFGGAGLAPTGYEGGYGLVPRDDTWICTIKKETNAVEWERIECDRRPEARLAATLNCLDNNDSGGKFLLAGGYDSVSKGTFSEPWILSVVSED